MRTSLRLQVERNAWNRLIQKRRGLKIPHRNVCWFDAGFGKPRRKRWVVCTTEFHNCERWKHRQTCACLKLTLWPHSGEDDAIPTLEV